ncbi:MAG: sirohydrochlorin cobaltochelatase, partial [Clostridia bacterium]|nr:sirohydrochlorin cobaltochelatase [Clostridia bacterium]
MSKPLLCDDADLNWMASLLSEIAREEDRPLLMMGHGTEHAANERYARLRERVPQSVFLACVEGEYSLEGVL